MNYEIIWQKKKRRYLKKIFKILIEVDDLWVLNLVYELTYNVTRKED